MISSNRAGFGTFFRASGAALQWRLMLLWVLALLVPTVLVALPFSAFLGAQLDNSLLGANLSKGFDGGAFTDVMMALTPAAPALSSAFISGLVITLLLSPLLTGMAIAAIRSGRTLGFGELVHGGISEYGRLFRLMIIGGIVLGLAFAAAAGLTAAVSSGASEAIVEADIEGKSRWALFGAILILALVHSTVEAARAQFAADSQLRSAFRAYGRGVMQLVRRPIATFGLYLLVTVVGLALASLLGVWRLSAASTIIAFLITQLLALVTVWMRTARLYALAEVALDR